MSSNKRKAFKSLCQRAEKCVVCPDLADKVAVLGPGNGNINPRVLFVAEAPGRQGADRTRKPFWGDKSGENFQVLIDSIRLKREEIFITNSVMCSPRKPSGANRRPKQSEIKNCSQFLRETIELIDPSVVVTLGTVALGAIESIEPHGLRIKTAIQNGFDWYGRRLVPLYHPSPQVFAAIRRLDDQLADYAVLGRELEKIESKIMKEVEVYGLPHCSTCKKAVAYLEENGVKIKSFRDVKEDRLKKSEVNSLVKLVGDAEALFSKRAIKYRQMKLNERQLSAKEMKDLMFDEYTFIKRPVVVAGDKAIAGFSVKRFEAFLNE